MITDLISRLPLYEQVIPGAELIAGGFAKNAPVDVPCEVREKNYKLKADADRRFEVHYHTIDLMMVRSGGERIDICPEAALEAAELLPNGADGRKLNGVPQGTAVELRAGCFCAIFPGEAHMVAGKLNGEAQVEKWVVKVPCKKEFCIEA